MIEKADEKSYEFYDRLMGIDVSANKMMDSSQAEDVKDIVRGILGINELFKIRKFIIDRSKGFIDSNA